MGLFIDQWTNLTGNTWGSILGGLGYSLFNGDPSIVATYVLNSGLDVSGYHTQIDYLLNPGSIAQYTKDDWTNFKHALMADTRKDREQMVTSATSARRIVYGRTRVGGTIPYACTSGAGNQYLSFVIVLAAHKVDSFEILYFDDTVISGVGNGWAILGGYTAFVSLERFDGTQTDACSSLTTDSGGVWTADHKLLGCTYLYLKLYYSESLFPTGLPAVKMELKGKKIYDPRTGLTAWSDNPALCIRDYMMLSSKDGGMGCDISEIDDTAIMHAANVCDEIVTIPGGTEKRYTMNGIISLDATPAEILKNMLASMAGQALYSGGVWKIYAGEWVATVATLDESWLRGGISFQAGNNKNGLINTVKGTFTNPTDSWSDTEYPSVPIGIGTPPNVAYWSVLTSPLAYNAAVNYAIGEYCRKSGLVYKATAIIELASPPPSTGWEKVEEYSLVTLYPSTGHVVQRGGVVYTSIAIVPEANPYLAIDEEELSASVNTPFSTSQTLSQRLAMIVIEKSRRGMTINYPCNMRAAHLEVLDAVKINNSQLGWIEKTFRILSRNFSAMGGVSLSLIDDDPAIWSDPALYGILEPPAMTNLPAPWEVADPTGFTATEKLYATVTLAAMKSRLNLAWTAGGASGSRYDIAVDGTIIQTIADTSYSINDLAPGTYSVAVRAKNSLNAVSAWVTINKAVLGNTAAPTTVAGFSGAFAGDSIALTWTPNTDADLALYEIRTGASWAAGTVVQSTRSLSYRYRPSASGTVTFWLAALDTAGNYSTAVSVSVTVPAVGVPTALATTPLFTAIDVFATYDTTRLDTAWVEIWAATTNNRNTAVQIGVTRTGTHQHQGLGNGAARWYWCRCINVFGQTGAWYPSGATSGVSGVALNDPGKMIQLMNPDVTDGAITDYLANHTPLISLLDTRTMLFELGVVGPGVTATFSDALRQAASQMNANQTLLEYLNNTVAGLTVSAYNGATAYTTGQIVTYLGQTYQCILASTGKLPTNVTYWSPISHLYEMINTVQLNLDTATGEWTIRAATLTADVADLANPTDGRVTLAETTIILHGTNITLQGTAITGPLAFVVGAVTETGVVVETVKDIPGLDVTVSRTKIDLDSANNAISLRAAEINNLTGRTSAAEILIDGHTAAIALKASSGDLSGQVDILSGMIGLKLNATGTVGPGMAIGWTDGTHIKSIIRFNTDTLQIGKTDSTGYRSVFTVGSINGSSAVGISGDLLVDGAIGARQIAANALYIGTDPLGNPGKINMGTGAVISWGSHISGVPTNLFGLVGSEPILNSAIFLAANGTLSGGSGGAVTITGLGFTGALNANYTTNTNQLTDGANLGGTAVWTGVSSIPANLATAGASPTVSVLNTGITIDVSGNITGIGSGNNTTVKNQMITISAGGVLVGVGTADIIVDNGKVTLASLSAMPLTPATPTSIGSNWIYTGTLTAAQINGITITGSTIQTAVTGERFVVDVSSKAAHFYDSSGAEKVWIGIASVTGLSSVIFGAFGAFAAFGVFGALTSGENRHGLCGLSNSGYGLVGRSVSGDGLLGMTMTGVAIRAIAGDGYGVVCGAASQKSLKITPSGIWPNGNITADAGTFCVSSDNKFYFCVGGTAWNRIAEYPVITGISATRVQFTNSDNGTGSVIDSIILEETFTTSGIIRILETRTYNPPLR